MGGRSGYYEESRPPWEKSAASVPYLSSGSPGLTEAERQGLPSLWATREQEQAARRKGSRDFYAREYQDDRRPMPPDEPESWRGQTPLTAPPWTAPRQAPPPPIPPVPYESPKIPQGPRSAPALPGFTKGPYSPPLSSGKSWSTTKSSPGQYEGRPSITALPGTMSARERSRSRPRMGRSASVDAPSPIAGKGESPSFGKRLKLAFKDMFRRDPVDDSNLERIEGRHWAEDEY